MMLNKIYLREFPDGIARFWERKKKEDVVASIPHEYIRKDWLLEWAKEKVAMYERKMQEFEQGSEYEVDAYRQIVEKLNSL